LVAKIATPIDVREQPVVDLDRAEDVGAGRPDVGYQPGAAEQAVDDQRRQTIVTNISATIRRVNALP
jgi:hypothetical protein